MPGEGGGGHDHPNDNHPPRQGIEEDNSTTQMTIIRRLGEGGGYVGHTTQMTIIRGRGAGGEGRGGRFLSPAQMTISHGAGGGGER